jgi:hypothetical protein
MIVPRISIVSARLPDGPFGDGGIQSAKRDLGIDDNVPVFFQLSAQANPRIPGPGQIFNLLSQLLY